MTATVTELPARPAPVTTLRPAPGWDRSRRQAALERLSEQTLHPDDVTAVLILNTSPALTGSRAADLWLAYLAELDLAAKYYAGDRRFADLEPDGHDRRAAQAMDDLLDGTTTYDDDGAEVWPA